MFRLCETAVELFRFTIIKCWEMMDCFIVAYCTDTTGVTHLKIVNILSAFAELWKETISFVMSARPSVRMKQPCCRWTELHEIWYLNIFRKTAEKTQVSLKSDKNDGTVREDQYTFLIISRSVLRMRNVSDKSCRGNQNTHFVFSNFFEDPTVYETVEKYCTAGQAIDDNMAHAHCVLDN